MSKICKDENIDKSIVLKAQLRKKKYFKDFNLNPDSGLKPLSPGLKRVYIFFVCPETSSTRLTGAHFTNLKYILILKIKSTNFIKL